MKISNLGILVVAIMCLSTFTPAHSQDENEAREVSPTQIEVLSPEQAKAVEILKKAAQKQGGEKILASLKSFQAIFNMEVHDPEAGQANFYVERYFEDYGHSGRMWTKKKHDSKNSPFSTIVHDGEEAWRIGHDGEVAIFTDKPDAYKTDLQNLEDDLQLTKQMFRFFFVKTMLEELDDLSFVGQGKERKNDVFILKAKTKAWLGGEKKTRVYLSIFVDKNAFTINEVRLSDLSQGVCKRTFVFSRYCRNAQDVLVPGNVKIFGESLNKPKMQIALKVKGDEGNSNVKVPQIDFNTAVPPEYFKIPAPEK